MLGRAAVDGELGQEKGGGDRTHATVNTGIAQSVRRANRRQGHITLIFLFSACLTYSNSQSILHPS